MKKSSQENEEDFFQCVGRSTSALVRNGKNARFKGRNNKLCNCITDEKRSQLGKLTGEDGGARKKVRKLKGWIVGLSNLRDGSTSKPQEN